MHDENVTRRKCVLVLQAIKIFTANYSIIFFTGRDFDGTHIRGCIPVPPDVTLLHAVRRFLNVIILVESAAFFIFLFLDLFYFGSGMKDYFSLKKFKNRIVL